MNKKSFFTVIVFLFLNCCFLLQAVESVPRVEKILNPDLSVVHFIPGGHRGGIYDKGEKVVLSLALKSKKGGQIRLKGSVLDFYGKKCSTVDQSVSLASGKTVLTSVPVKDPGRYGHYTVELQFFRNGKLAGVSQSAFAVIPPPPVKADPWFEIDGRNAPDLNDNPSLYKRLGAGSFGLINVRTVADPRKQSLAYRDYFTKGADAKFERVVGYLGIGEPRPEKEPKILRKKGFFPYSAEQYEKYDEMVRECARLGKDTIQLWCIVQEVDAAMTFAESPLTVMADHVIRVKRWCRILREVNPKCKIAIMNSCGDDFFNNGFRYVRMLLKETAKYVDYFAIDGYSGTWNGVLSPLEEPEKGGRFKALMLASSKLAKEFGLPETIIQAERGYFVPYTAAFNSPIVRDLANFNARSMILARAMPFIKYYSRHGACRWYTPAELAYQKINPHRVLDGGLVRSVYDHRKRITFQPRPSAAAYATVARLLAFVSDPEELQITRDLYACHFKRPDGKRVAALWSTGNKTRAVFHLLSGTVHCDLMGESTVLKAGKNTIEISQSPCFLILDAEKKACRDLLRKAHFPDIKNFTGFLRCTGKDQYDLILGSLTNRDLCLRIQSTPGLKGANSCILKGGERTVVPLRGKSGSVTVTDGSGSIRFKVPSSGIYVIPYGKTLQKLITLRYPDHVRPLAALRAERNLFRGDGSDITADFSASYDEKNLYLHFRVKDSVHLQRHSGSRIWRDDCIQVGIDAGNNALPKEMTKSLSYDRDDHIFGFALTQNGPVSHFWYHGRSTNSSSVTTQIVRKDGETLYSCTVPWKELPEINVRKGSVFGLTFLVMDNNEKALRTAPYRLEWTPGIAGGADPAQFHQVILQ